MRTLAALLAFLLTAFEAHSGTLRIATYNTELSREGPGLLLRDIERGGGADIDSAVRAVAEVQPDILVLQGLDWDLELRALSALRRRLATAGAAYPHFMALQPNTGRPTGLDLDGDGRTGDARDAQGYGRFTGQNGMALLSQHPIRQDGLRDLSALLWQDLPGALLPRHPDGSAFPSEAALAVQRLSSTGHWIVPVVLPDGNLFHLMLFQATPPVFDGPEDRNGRRNHDEISLWRHVLDGAFGPPPPAPFAIAGGANLDPGRGEGRHTAIRTLLEDPRLQDPRPASRTAGLNTVEWETAGRMRVDYVLPSADLNVTDSGVHWPEGSGSPGSRHRLVWVDVFLEE
jgi:endonuclease/exonuclease/phosphatase family metal-dependent hydrolase